MKSTQALLCILVPFELKINRRILMLLPELLHNEVTISCYFRAPIPEE